eukprot:2504138-Amphidinium_carterae.1
MGRHCSTDTARMAALSMSRKAQSDEKRSLKPKHIAENLSAENSELCKRLSFGLSMSAGSIQSALQYISKYGGADDKFTQFGLPELKKKVESGEGKKFMDACEYLNMENETTIEKEMLQTHVKNFWKFLRSDKETLSDTLRRLVMSSARVYLASTSLLELIALDSHREHWAKAFDKRPPSKETKMWL